MHPRYPDTASENATRRARQTAWRNALLALLLVFTAATEAQARNWRVQVGGSQLAFAPKVLAINTGDTVTFSNMGGFHNVVADNGAFRCAHGCDGDGHGGSGNSSASIWFVTIAFPTAGTVGYFCEAHGTPGVGMFGTIIVQQLAPVVVPVAPGGALPFGALLVGALIAAAALQMRRRSKFRRSGECNFDQARKPR